MEVAKDIIGGTSTYLITSSPLYVGGKPSDYFAKGIDYLGKESLLGCIKNLALNGVPAGQPVASFDVEPCTRCSGHEKPGECVAVVMCIVLGTIKYNKERLRVQPVSKRSVTLP